MCEDIENSAIAARERAICLLRPLSRFEKEVPKSNFGKLVPSAAQSFYNCPLSFECLVLTIPSLMQVVHSDSGVNPPVSILPNHY